MRKLRHREFKKFAQGQDIISGGAWNPTYIIKLGKEDIFKLTANNAMQNVAY